ncbi:hypothetical protein AEM51_08450 [Bacteroidetes bacterium UKL13-3]|jgi:hypothetical protein|nr:hypothetical protein AEM51_08450 [Bacteroidetes bacterium UKL13-3]HCP92960.1 hypothetical protein [Bacteroidota bacterium]
MRKLYQKEKLLINCILEGKSHEYDIENLYVSEMNDGGMGSLYFIMEDKDEHYRKMGRMIVEKQFLDTDNVPILVSLNVDEDGYLFELDIWRADFGIILEYPTC